MMNKKNKKGLDNKTLLCYNTNTKEKEEITMKEQIINILQEHPGLRKREIAGYLHIHHFKIISLLDEMEQEGSLVRKYHHDPANMEFYDKYYVRT